MFYQINRSKIDKASGGLPDHKLELCGYGAVLGLERKKTGNFRVDKFCLPALRED